MSEQDFTKQDVQAVEAQGEPAIEQSQVQPDEGQGRGDTTGLYDLSSIDDPAIRSHVERIAKDIDRNVQAKFQEHAEFRKSFEPFQEMGLQEQDPDAVRKVLELAHMLGDDETAQDAVLRLAQEVGLEVDGLDGDDEDYGFEEVDPLQARLDALEAAEFERQQQAASSEELGRLQSEWDEVVSDHGRPFSEKEQGLLVELAERFDSEPEPIKAAYRLLNQAMGLGEQSLVKAKSSEPSAAEPRGRASTAVTPPDTFEEAQRLFTERNSQVHAA